MFVLIYKFVHNLHHFETHLVVFIKFQRKKHANEIQLIYNTAP